jgi:hypothetical protein
MKQKDLIKYGLIGLAVYFLFLKKEDTAQTDDTTGDGPAVNTGGQSATGGPKVNSSGGSLSNDNPIVNSGGSNQGDPGDDENFTPYSV